MTEFNVLGWCLLIGFALWGLRGGSGMFLFSGVLIAISGGVAHLIYHWILANTNRQNSTAALISLSVLLICCFIAFPLGAYINRFVQFNLDPFDWTAGVIFAFICAGMIISLAFGTLLLYYQDTPQYQNFRQSYLVRQLVYFEGWHHLTNAISNLQSKGAELPNPE